MNEYTQTVVSREGFALGTTRGTRMTSEIIRWFAYEHLDGDKQLISKEFNAIAVKMDEALPAGAEKAVVLRKLLEAKDAAVRSSMESGRVEGKAREGLGWDPAGPLKGRNPVPRREPLR